MQSGSLAGEGKGDREERGCKGCGWVWYARGGRSKDATIWEFPSGPWHIFSDVSTDKDLKDYMRPVSVGPRRGL